MGYLGLDNDTWRRITSSLIVAALVVYDKDDEMTPEEIAESALKHADALVNAEVSSD